MSQDFDEGFQLGARVEHRVAVEAVAGALLDILGKDAGDGIISLGTAGYWARESGRWVQVARGGTKAGGPNDARCAHAYLSIGDTCAVCGLHIVADYRGGVPVASK